MNDQYAGATDTSVSNSEQRMKVGAGCSHGKKKCLKCAMSGAKKDGMGGPGLLPFGAPGYGQSQTPSGGLTVAPKAPAMPPMTNKPHRASSKLIGGLKMKGMKSLASSVKSISKGMKFGKAVKGSKARSLKSVLKSVI